MIICIAREGRDGCSWWYAGKCNNNTVPLEIKMVCTGKLLRLLPKEVSNVS